MAPLKGRHETLALRGCKDRQGQPSADPDHPSYDVDARALDDMPARTCKVDDENG